MRGRSDAGASDPSPTVRRAQVWLGVVGLTLLAGCGADDSTGGGDTTSSGSAGGGGAGGSGAAGMGGTPASGACTFEWAGSPEEVGLSSSQLLLATDTAAGWVADDTIVGGVLLVLRHGKIVVHEAFGWADRERDLPMATDTIFDIRSNTKPLTGTVALMLHEEGQLALDHPVSASIPSWDNDNSRDITAYQLFTHTAGLPHSLNSYNSLAEMVDQIGIEGPELPPGTAYQYSDRGSNSLGRLVEVIANVPAESFVAQRLVEPLGLGDTFGVLTDDDPRRPRVAAKYAGGAGSWTKTWDNTESSTSIYAPAYGHHATALDYGCFLEVMRRGGQLGDVRLLDAETVQTATRPHSDYVYPPTEAQTMDTFYGLHWFVTIRTYDPDHWDEAVHMFGHGGAMGTTAWVDRQHDLVFVYFTQSKDNDTLLQLRGLVHDALVD